MIFTKGSHSGLSAHFNTDEFDCHCFCKSDTLVDRELIVKLERLREIVGKPIKITSGFRCAKKQAELRSDGRHEAAKISTHEKGMAADIWVQGVRGRELAELAERAGFTSIGVAKTWIHVDTRDGVHRWQY